LRAGFLNYLLRRNPVELTDREAATALGDERPVPYHQHRQ
jgi:hypothetical protein